MSSHEITSTQLDSIRALILYAFAGADDGFSRKNANETHTQSAIRFDEILIQL